jgi:putative FmdB family regulatory protein
MPLYEYQCQECGTIIEAFQKLSEDKLTECNCETCKSIQPVKKIITSMHFKLIGRGWANDGYVDTYQQSLEQI